MAPGEAPARSFVVVVLAVIALSAIVAVAGTKKALVMTTTRPFLLAQRQPFNYICAKL